MVMEQFCVSNIKSSWQDIFGRLCQENTFENSSNPPRILFLQDGGPSQNHLKAKNAAFDIGAWMIQIPPRSPDINPVENFFHLMKKTIE